MRLKIDYVSAFDERHFDTEDECREHMDEDKFMKEEVSLENIIEKLKDLDEEDSILVKKTNKGWSLF